MCDKVLLDEILHTVVSRLKNIFCEKLHDVILFGSYARGNFEVESDIDILVLVDIDDYDLNKFIPVITDATYDLDLDFNVVISIILKNVKHFENWKNTLPFYMNVDKEGVRISA